MGLASALIFTWMIGSEATPAAYMRAAEFAAWAMLFIFVLAVLNIGLLCRRALLTPVAVVFTWAALTFGLGALYFFHGPPDQVYIQLDSFGISDHLLYRLQVMNLLAFVVTALSLLLGLRLVGNWMNRVTALQPDMINREADILGIGRFSHGALFTLFAVLFTNSLYFNLTYFLTGVEPERQLPGFLRQASQAGLLAILVAAFQAARKGGFWWSGLIIAVILPMGKGLVTMSNGEFTMPMLVMLVGLYSGGTRLRWLIIGFLGVLLLFFLIRPITDVGKSETGARTNRSTPWVAASWWLNLTPSDLLEMRQGDRARGAGWSRLNYLGIHGAVVNLHDAGQPGTSFSNILWTFVPRIIYPEKPAFVGGSEMYYAVRGHASSTSISATAFGEAYWNGGISFVIVAAASYGLLLAVASVLSVWLFAQPNMLALPVGLLWLEWGRAVASTFSVGVVGGFVMCTLLTCVVFLAERFLVQRRRRALSVT